MWLDRKGRESERELEREIERNHRLGCRLLFFNIRLSNYRLITSTRVYFRHGREQRRRMYLKTRYRVVPRLNLSRGHKEI